MRTAFRWLPDHIVRIFGTACLIIPYLLLLGCSTCLQGQDTLEYRDPYLWPFDQHSIWNMPIGSGAQYRAQPIDPAQIDGVMVDLDIIIMTPDEDLRDVYATRYLWEDGTNQDTRCEKASEAVYLRLPVPDGYVTNFYGSRPNNPGAILKPDGRSIAQTQPFQVCPDGLITTGLRKTGSGIIQIEDTDIYGDGRLGMHGGSGLSSLGGAIRIGELSPGSEPIRHVLKISFPGEHYLYYDHEQDLGYRWPAVKDDSNAADFYNGTEPEAKQGCLRAIPPWIDIGSLGLETEPGRKIAWTLKNYGAYQVEGVPWARMMIAAEDSPEGCVPLEFKKDWGYDFVTQDKTGNPWFRDMIRLMGHLHVVSNNGPNTIGGGGEPLQPLAPDLYPSRRLEVTTDGTPGVQLSATEKWVFTPERSPRIFVDIVPPGYAFSHWTLIGGRATIDDPESIVTTVQLDSSAATVQANFDPQYYSLDTAVNGQGVIGIEPFQDHYVYDSNITLQALPAPGWEFQSWGGDLDGAENPLTFNITRNSVVTANFVPAYYSMVVGIGGKGSVDMQPEGDSLPGGTTVILTARPDPGWAFRNWTGDLTSQENPLTLTVDRDWILYASFDTLETSAGPAIQGPDIDGTMICMDHRNRFLHLPNPDGLNRGILSLRDLYGRELVSMTVSGQTAVRIPLEGLPPGIYLACIRDGSSKVEVMTFMIAR